MAKLLAAVRLVLRDLKPLQNRAVDVGLAGAAALILSLVAGVHLNAGEVAGYLGIVGFVAATLQKLLSGQAAAKLAADRRRST